MAVGIEYLVAWEDFLETLDDEAFAAIAIEPAGLFGQPMVEHIGHGDKGVSLYLLDHDAEHARAHQKSCLAELFEGIFAKVLITQNDCLIVFSHVLFLVFDLFQKAGALQLRQ